jgi:hypothetical protein
VKEFARSCDTSALNDGSGIIDAGNSLVGKYALFDRVRLRLTSSTTDALSISVEMRLVTNACAMPNVADTSSPVAIAVRNSFQVVE